MQINNKKEIEKYQKEIESLKNEKQEHQNRIDLLEVELSTLKAQNADANFTKENEIVKYKSQIKKYKDLLKSKGITV